MAEQIENGRRPGWEVIDDPQRGRVVQCNHFINHPDEEMKKYEGLYVAWSMDGYKVLASGKTPNDLSRAVKELKLGDDEWVFSFIEPPGGPLRTGIITLATRAGE